jgi:hypothetical protein
MDPKTFENLPPDLKKNLRTDYGYSGLAALKPVPAKLPTEPYTLVGASHLKGEYFDPYLDDNTQGVTYKDKQGNSFVALNPKGTDQTNTRAHEMEHVLANQGLGSAARLNSLWDETVNDFDSRRGTIVSRLVEHAPYLQEKWGLEPIDVESGYFSKNVLKRPDTRNFLYEQMATLSGLEQSKNKRLTDDPYVRKHILKTKAERETYNALTGLRQSRLDSKDLPPYTRQPDKSDPTFFQKLKDLVGLASGGYVENAGNKKLI